MCAFEKPNTSPNSLSPSTTVLSPYLKFGCLSPRLFFHGLQKVTFEMQFYRPGFKRIFVSWRLSKERNTANLQFLWSGKCTGENFIMWLDRSLQILIRWLEILFAVKYRGGPMKLVSKLGKRCAIFSQLKYLNDNTLLRAKLGSPLLMPWWLNWEKRGGFIIWQDTLLPAFSLEEICGSHGKKARR